MPCRNCKDGAALLGALRSRAFPNWRVSFPPCDWTIQPQSLDQKAYRSPIWICRASVAVVTVPNELDEEKFVPGPPSFTRLGKL